MARVVLTASADADSAEIIAYLNETVGADVADRYDAHFDNAFRQLAQFPNSGAPRLKLGAHVRIAVVAPYVIIYEHVEDNDVLTIMRIVHGRRKITRGLVEGG